MKHIIATTALIMTLCVAVVSAKADFSGTWILDKSNSEGLPPGMDQSMTVVHTGDKLLLETKLITQEGERVVSDMYMLDGKEAEFTPKTPGGQAGKGKRTLSADGKTLKFDIAAEGPNGKQQIKRTFVKK